MSTARRVLDTKDEVNHIEAKARGTYRFSSMIDAGIRCGSAESSPERGDPGRQGAGPLNKLWS